MSQIPVSQKLLARLVVPHVRARLQVLHVYERYGGEEKNTEHDSAIFVAMFQRNTRILGNGVTGTVKMSTWQYYLMLLSISRFVAIGNTEHH